MLGLDDIEEFRESVYDLERRTVAALTPEFDLPERPPSSATDDDAPRELP